MGKMFIDLFFPDAYRLREVPGAHLLFTEENDYPLTNRLHVTPKSFVLSQSNVSSSSHVARKGVYRAEIRKKRLRVPSDFPRVLDEEVPEAQFLGVLEDLLKFVPGHLAVQRRI